MRTNLFWISTILAFGLASSQTILAQERNGLKGTWRVQVTPVSCTTGEPNGKPIFQALDTYAQGGTFTNTSDSPALIGNSSPGFGFWYKTDDHTYSYIFELQIYASVGPPYEAGTQKVFATATLSDENDWTGHSVTQLFNSSNTNYLTLCSATTATRLNDSQSQP